MLLHFVPGNWFLIFLALALGAWLKIAGVNNQSVFHLNSANASLGFIKK